MLTLRGTCRCASTTVFQERVGEGVGEGVVSVFSSWFCVAIKVENVICDSIVFKIVFVTNTLIRNLLYCGSKI